MRRMNVDRPDGTPAAPTRPRRGRPRKSEVGLNRERILEATAGLINDGGTDKLTMRAISLVLGVDAMSLYRHFANKDELLDGVALRFLDALPWPTPTGDLTTDIRELSLGFRQAAAAEPQVAVLLLTRQLGSMTGLALTDSALGVLRAAGFTPDDAVHGFRSVFAFLVGTVLRESSVGPTFADKDFADQNYRIENRGGLVDRRDELLSAGLHNVAESASSLAALDHDREFEFGLDVLIGGLERYLATTRGEDS